MELQELKNLAHLARIKLSDEELQKIGTEFSSILDYVAQINAVQMDVAENHSIQTNMVRNDIARTDNYDGQVLLTDAPDSQDGFYKVPKIL